jgi:hypothetical protein
MKSNYKMTQNEAIDACKEMWAAIKYSQMSKKEFLRSSHGNKYREADWEYDCPLCDWVSKGNRYKVSHKRSSLWCEEYDRSRRCPLVRQFHKTCVELGFDTSYCAGPQPKEFFEVIENLHHQSH